jgi:hypothetical protein
LGPSSVKAAQLFGQPSKLEKNQPFSPTGGDLKWQAAFKNKSARG